MIKILNELSTFQLLGAISLRSPFGERDHALIRLALQSGLRVSELCGLDVEHVYLRGRPCEWLDLPASIAKGRKSRYIPLAPPARKAIQDLMNFLVKRGLQVGPKAPLLQDRHHQRLTPREVQRLVKQYREQADLSIKVTPHTLRHSYASQLASTTPIRMVQQMLGHERISSTEVYLHTQPEQLMQAAHTLPDFGAF